MKTLSEFLFLLATCSILTIMLTDALKTLLNKTQTIYRANAVALDSAMITCTGISVLYRIPSGLYYSPVLLYRLIILILCTWFTATLLYDKLRQSKRQYEKYKRLKMAKKNKSK